MPTAARPRDDLSGACRPEGLHVADAERQCWCNAEIRDNRNLATNASLEGHGLRKSNWHSPTPRPEFLNPRTTHRAPDVGFREDDVPAEDPKQSVNSPKCRRQGRH